MKLEKGWDGGLMDLMTDPCLHARGDAGDGNLNPSFTMFQF